MRIPKEIGIEPKWFGRIIIEPLECWLQLLIAYPSFSAFGLNERGERAPNRLLAHNSQHIRLLVVALARQVFYPGTMRLLQRRQNGKMYHYSKLVPEVYCRKAISAGSGAGKDRSAPSFCVDEGKASVTTHFTSGHEAPPENMPLMSAIWKVTTGQVHKSRATVTIRLNSRLFSLGSVFRGV